MKKDLRHQFVNILSFILIISLPFALSSQTRKAIPAGRYESLSGVKSLKNKQGELETNIVKNDGQVDFWLEVVDQFSQKENELSYFSFGILDKNISDLLEKRNFQLSPGPSDKNLIIYTDNFLRDKHELVKHVSSKTHIVLSEKIDIKDLVKKLSEFEIVAYRHVDGKYFYLLRFKQVQ